LIGIKNHSMMSAMKRFPTVVRFRGFRALFSLTNLALLGVFLVAGCGQEEKERGPVAMVLYGFRGWDPDTPTRISEAYVIREESNYVKFRVGDRIYTHSGRYLIVAPAK
jgi:hypothetical protein